MFLQEHLAFLLLQRNIKTLYMVALGLIAAAIGAWLLIGLPWDNWGLNNLAMWIVLPIVIILSVVFMKHATPSEIKTNLKSSFPFWATNTIGL